MSTTDYKLALGGFIGGIVESFRTCSRTAMLYIIIRPDGEPLLDLDGATILVASKQEAREFLMPGETVADWEGWAAREEC